MIKKDAESILEEVIERLEFCLDELSETDKDNEFCYGEKTAYVECLEWIQSWEKAEEKGLDFEVEERYPL